MKGSLKFILGLVIVLILAVGGILLYQTYGVSEGEDIPDEIDIQNEKSADEAADNASIFDQTDGDEEIDDWDDEDFDSTSSN